MTPPLPSIFDLTITEGNISSITDAKGVVISKFGSPLTGRCYKLYVVVENSKIAYIGTTKTSIKNRLRYGMKATGKNGYHGYKWKGLPQIRLFVWCFENLDKFQIESVEAELAFLERKEGGKWPAYQNEIHFNNTYEKGSKVAEEIYHQIQENTLQGLPYLSIATFPITLSTNYTPPQSQH